MAKSFDDIIYDLENQHEEELETAKEEWREEMKKELEKEFNSIDFQWDDSIRVIDKVSRIFF